MPRRVDLLARRRDALTRSQDGYTLVEMLVVVLILGIVGAVFSTSMIQAIGTDRKTRDRADTQSSLTVAMERVSRHVRVAAPLVSVSAASVVVDVFPDQPSGSSLRERYTFSITGGNLEQRLQAFQPATSTVASSDSSRVLARGLLAGSGFTAFDRSGAASTIPVRVASIDIVLVADRRETKDYTAKTSVYLRNYKG